MGVWILSLFGIILSAGLKDVHALVLRCYVRHWSVCCSVALILHLGFCICVLINISTTLNNQSSSGSLVLKQGG